MTGGLEARLVETDERARSLVANAGHLARAAKQLQKASATGDLVALGAARSKVEVTLKDAVRAAEEAAAWSWTEAEEAAYLADGYIQELRSTAASAGVELHQYGNSWSAYPTIIRVEPAARALRLDRRRIRDLRPSVVVRAIQKARQAKPRLRPDQFLEVLHAGYRSALGRVAFDTGAVRPSAGVPLMDVYEALTLMPTMRKDYPVEEFARDVHQLNLSDARVTKDAYAVDFRAATATKTGSRVLTVVDGNARPFHYFSIAFTRTEQ